MIVWRSPVHTGDRCGLQQTVKCVENCNSGDYIVVSTSKSNKTDASWGNLKLR